MPSKGSREILINKVRKILHILITIDKNYHAKHCYLLFVGTELIIIIVIIIIVVAVITIITFNITTSYL